MGKVFIELPKVKPFRDRAAEVLKEALGIELSEKLIRYDGWLLQVEGERRIIWRRKPRLLEVG